MSRPVATSNIPQGAYEQQFHKYSELNNDANRQATYSNIETVKHTTFTSEQPNTINYNSNPKPWDLPPPTTTSQFSRPYGSTQVVSSMGASDSSNDFLKKIDEQLEASRRQFPNRS